MPQTGEDVLIPCEWTVKYDLASASFNSITIDGMVRFDETLPAIKLLVSYIFVRGGKLAAGLADVPFNNKLEIILTGGMNADYVSIDEYTNPGNKAIVVTGRVELYGVAPTTKWTRLTASAKPGDSVINVASAVDWKVGDELVLGPA